MEFLCLLLRHRFARSQVATSQNIGRFLRLAKQSNVLHFETMEEAVVRVRKQKRQEDLVERKKKRHCLPPNQDNFHKENLLQEVTNKKDGEKVSIKLFYVNLRPYTVYGRTMPKKVHIMCVKFSFSLKILK